MTYFLENSKQLDLALGIENDKTSDLNDTLVRSSTVSFAVRIKQSIFMVLATCLSVQYKPSKLGIIIGRLVKTLQLLHLVFNYSSPGTWKSKELGIIQGLAQYTSLIFADPSINAVVFFTFASFTAALSLLVVALGRSSWHQIHYSEFGDNSLYTFLANVLYAQHMFLFLPGMYSFLGVFKCTTDELFYGCSTLAHVITQVIAALCLLAFISFACCYEFFLVSRIPNKAHLLAKAHGRVGGVVLILEAGVVILMEFLKGSTWLTSMVIVIPFAWTPCFLYWYYFPYYRLVTNVSYTYPYAVTSFAGTCILLRQTLMKSTEDKVDFGAFITFLGVSPILWLFVWRLLYSRKSYLVSNLQAHTSGFLIEAALRYEADLPTWNEEIEGTYRDAADFHFVKDGFLNVHVAMLMRNLGNSEILAGQYIRRAKLEDTFPDLVFFMFVHRLDNMQAQVQRGEMNVSLYEAYRVNAVDLLTETTNLTTKFWSNLLRQRRVQNEKILTQLGNKLFKTKMLTNQAMEDLLEVGSTQPMPFELYAMFIKYVQNNPKLSATVAAHGLKQAELQGINHFDLQAGICARISGNNSNLGEILEVSAKLENLFGYAKSKLDGQKINVLCPYPFNEIHDHFLRKYIENSSTKKSGSITRRVWGLRKDNDVLPLDLRITSQITSDEELIFIGSFEPVDIFYDKFIMINDEMKICFGSKNAWENILGIRCPSQGNQAYYLEDLIESSQIEELHRFLETESHLTHVQTLGAHKWSIVAEKIEIHIKNRGQENIDQVLYLLCFGEKSATTAKLDDLDVVKEDETRKRAQSATSTQHSVRSGSTLTSATSAHKAKVQRDMSLVGGVLNIGRNRVNKFAVYLLLCLALCTFAVFVELANKINMSKRISNGAELLYLSSTRTVLIGEVGEMFRLLYVLQDTSVKTDFEIRAMGSIKSLLRQRLEELSETHMKIMLQSETILDGGLTLDKSFEVFSVLTDIHNERAFNDTLSISVNSFVSFGLLEFLEGGWLADNSSSNHVICESFGCKYIMNNDHTLRNSSVQWTNNVLHITQQHSEALMSSEIQITIIALLGFIPFCFVVLVPLTREVIQSQKAITCIFMKLIPPNTLRELRQKASASAKEVEELIQTLAAENEINEEEDGGYDNDSELRAGSTASGNTSKSNRSNGSRRSHLVDLNFQRGDRRAKTRKSDTKQQSIADKLERDSSSRPLSRWQLFKLELELFKTSFKILLWPFAVTVAYFMFVNANESNHLLNRQVKLSSIYFSGKRSAALVDMGNSAFQIGLPNLEWGIWSKESNDERRQAVLNNMVDLISIHEATIYGDEAQNIEQFRWDSEDQFHLIYRDGCLDTCIHLLNKQAQIALKSGMHAGFGYFSDWVVKNIAKETNQLSTARVIEAFEQVRSIREGYTRSIEIYHKSFLEDIDDFLAEANKTLAIYLVALLCSLCLSVKLFSIQHQQAYMLQNLLQFFPYALWKTNSCLYRLMTTRKFDFKSIRAPKPESVPEKKKKS